MKPFLIPALILSLTITSCFGAPRIQIQNQSAKVLSNVRISGQAFVASRPTLAPGEIWREIVHPAAETGIRLEFDLNGKHFDSGPQGYFEFRGGYKVYVVVHENLSVSVSTTL